MFAPPVGLPPFPSRPFCTDNNRTHAAGFQLSRVHRLGGGSKGAKMAGNVQFGGFDLLKGVVLRADSSGECRSLLL